jgi:hypothetical protein
MAADLRRSLELPLTDVLRTEIAQHLRMEELLATHTDLPMLPKGFKPKRRTSLFFGVSAKGKCVANLCSSHYQNLG